MKLSWSQKLFLRINKTLGKRPLLDKVMYFCGQWLIFILLAVTGIAVLYDIWFTGSWYIVYICAIAFGITFTLSYVTALIFRHPRPIRELPHVKELIIPLETWKSFPSDHTIASTLCVLIIAAVSDETLFESVATLLAAMAAVLIMYGRVYCGVHYPRDILGGILFASIGAVLTVLICSRFFFG